MKKLFLSLVIISTLTLNAQALMIGGSYLKPSKAEKSFLGGFAGYEFNSQTGNPIRLFTEYKILPEEVTVFRSGNYVKESQNISMFSLGAQFTRYAAKGFYLGGDIFFFTISAEGDDESIQGLGLAPKMGLHLDNLFIEAKFNLLDVGDYEIRGFGLSAGFFFPVEE